MFLCSLIEQLYTKEESKKQIDTLTVLTSVYSDIFFIVMLLIFTWNFSEKCLTFSEEIERKVLR